MTKWLDEYNERSDDGPINWGPHSQPVASSECPICGKAEPHGHALEEAAELESKAAFIRSKYPSAATPAEPSVRPQERDRKCPQCDGSNVLTEPRTQLTCRDCQDVFLFEATEPDRNAAPPWQGCEVPPAGWWCSREAGHEGPCAARAGADGMTKAWCAAYPASAAYIINNLAAQIDAFLAARTQEHT